MTHDEAIKSLLETCENFSNAIDKLQEENSFLTETIEKNNLNKIVSERRSLLASIKQREMEANSLKRAANAIKSEYSDKLYELNERLSDLKSKQDDMDAYINASAEAKVSDERKEYQMHKSANDKALQKHKTECDKRLQEQISIYKEKRKKWLIAIICSILFGIIGIAVSFI